MKKLLLLILILSSCSTTNQKNKEQELSQQLDSIITIPYSHKDTSSLNPLSYQEEQEEDLKEQQQKHTDNLYKEAYRVLKNSKIFKKKGLNGAYGRIAITILSQQKKYKELDSLLQNNTLLSDYEKQLALNSNYFFMFHNQDSIEAIKYLKENDKIIQKGLSQKIKKENIEQINFLNIFIQNRAMLYGKEAGYKTIDSLTEKNKYLEKYNSSIKNQCDYFMELMKLNY